MFPSPSSSFYPRINFLPGQNVENFVRTGMLATKGEGTNERTNGRTGGKAERGTGGWMNEAN